MVLSCLDGAYFSALRFTVDIQLNPYILPDLHFINKVTFRGILTRFEAGQPVPTKSLKQSLNSRL